MCWNTFDLECLRGMSPESTTLYAGWCDRARAWLFEERTSDCYYQRWFPRHYTRSHWKPPMRALHRKSALLSVRQTIEMLINYQLISTYGLPPIDFCNACEVIALVQVTSPEMMHALIFGEPNPYEPPPTAATPMRHAMERRYREEKEREVREITQLLKDIAYLPWSTDCETEAADAHCSKWFFEADRDVFNTETCLSTMSNVEWKSILLMAIDAYDSPELAFARSQRRASAALWRIAVNNFADRVGQIMPPAVLTSCDDLTRFYPLKNSAHAWEEQEHIRANLTDSRARGSNRDPQQETHEKAANVPVIPANIPVIPAESNTDLRDSAASTSTATGGGTTTKPVEDTAVRAQQPNPSGVTPAATSSTGGALSSITAALTQQPNPSGVITRADRIRLGNDEHRTWKWIVDNRLTLFNEPIVEALKNYLLANIQSNQVVQLGNIFDPNFDDLFWKRTSRRLAATCAAKLTAEQLALLKKESILAYANKLPELIATLLVCYQQGPTAAASLIPVRVRIQKAYEAFPPKTNPPTETTHQWHTLVDQLTGADIKLRQQFPTEVKWEDADFQSGVLKELLVHYKHLVQTKPRDFSEMDKVLQRMQEGKEFPVLFDGYTPSPWPYPQSLLDFTVTLDVLGEEEDKIATFRNGGVRPSYNKPTPAATTSTSSLVGPARTAAKKDKKKQKQQQKQQQSQPGGNRQQQQSSTSSATATASTGVVTAMSPCVTCGKPHNGSCFHTVHPDRNQSTTAWADSDKGKAWKAAGYDTLRPGYLLDGTPFVSPKAKASGSSKPGKGKGGKDQQSNSFAGKKRPHEGKDKKQNKREYSDDIVAHDTYVTVPSSDHVREHSYILAALALRSTAAVDNDNDDYLMPTLIAIPSTSNPSPLLLQAKCLLDSGAIRYNYMSRSLATRLEKVGMQPHSRCAHVVNSALTSNSTKRKRCCADEMSECVACTQVVPAAQCDDNKVRPDVRLDSTTSSPGGTTVSQCHDLTIMLLTNKTKRRELSLTFSVIECPFDLIIGRQDIRKYDLTKYCREYFAPTTKPLLDHSDTTVPQPVTSTTASVVYPVANTQLVYDNGASNVDTVEELTITPDLGSERPDHEFGMLKGVRERSHQVHTAVHKFENEVTLKRRDSLRHELDQLRDRHLVTATCRGGQCCVTAQGPSESFDWKSCCNPCSRGLVSDSRFKATRDIYMAPDYLNLLYDTSDMSFKDVDCSSSSALPTKLSDFVGEEGTDPFDDMLSAVDNSIHYPSDTPPQQGENVVNELHALFEGDEEATRQLRSLLAEFSDIISKGYKKEPARVDPMELHVDLSLWETRENNQRVRPQSLERETELRKQLDKLEQAGVIEKSSTSQFWSQVLLVKKPHDDVSTGEKLWRFCVDYVNLNRASKPEKWPLPKIDDLLQQIGQNRPTVFAKIDLTHGFHQMMLAAAAMRFTAFIVAFGIYVWKRVPMGLKGAPGFFQGQMQKVLGILLLTCCALYIDDILIWGQTNAELLVNLRKVFERLREFNITIHPDKIFVGLKQLEFIGHTIDAEGLHFTREKIDKVFQIPIPVYDSEMKSFLGLAQYFSDHVQDFAHIAAPLHELIKQYDKRKKKRLDYTQEALDAFEYVKCAINDCPKLYFYDPTLPIYLATDASDIACGAYLYQVKDRKQIPIRFASRKFSATE